MKRLRKITLAILVAMIYCTNIYSQIATHEVQPGETLYSIARSNNISVESLINANPGIGEVLKAGSVIVIPPEAAATETTNVTATNTVTQTPQQPQCKMMYYVEKKETVYSISKRFGITIEEFLAANPTIEKNKVKKGQSVCIPYSHDELVQLNKQAEEQKREQELARQREEANKIHRFNSVKVGVVLPFALNDKKPSAETFKMYEMYEGFLLAVDSLKKKGVSVDIYTFDEKNSYNFVDTLVANNPIFTQLNMIFGPLRPSNITAFSSFAQKHNIPLVIPCSSRTGLVEGYQSNYQVNTNESYVYDKVYDTFIAKNNGSNIIFVNMNEASDKNAYINKFKEELTKRNIAFSSIDFSALDNLPQELKADKDNVLIPTSNTQNTFEILCYKLNNMESTNVITTGNIRLFGYPEWQTFNAKNKNNFNKYRASFFATFFNNPNDARTREFESKFRRWFKRGLMKSQPKFGLLGFDAGYYFITGLWHYGDKFSKYVTGNIKTKAYQNPLDFARINPQSGFVNRKVMFVEYSKDGVLNVKEY